MRRKYRHITFFKGQSGIWWCRANEGDIALGSVALFEEWKQFCYFPYENTVLSATCLEDIIHFLGQLNKPEKSPSVKPRSNVRWDTKLNHPIDGRK